MLNIDTLMTFLGSPESDREFVGECLIQAQSLVSAYVATTDVPEDIIDLSSQQVASEPFRVAKDPMTSVYAILGKWVCVGV